MRRITYKSNESGQSMLVTLAFLAILSVSLFLIYNTITLTANKRDLVNAADAAAYSGASVLAQGLNYTAYTNRAILANNAMIGQMVSIRSTLAMTEKFWRSSVAFWEAIEAIAVFIPVVGPAASKIATGIGKFSTAWGDKLLNPSRIMAEVLQVTGSAALGMANQVMWVSQQVHLADSLASFEPNMILVAKDNMPQAKVDVALHATVFGPVVTLGMFASQFTMKKRSNKRNMGTTNAQNDEYLQYVAERNRAGQTPDFVAGRRLLPNGLTLWMGTGCDTNPNTLLNGGLSGLLQPAAADFGEVANTVINAVQVMTGLMTPIVNPMLCLFERHGGTELIQLSDGKMAWVAVDAFAIKAEFLAAFPLMKILYPESHIPFAGGSVMSFTEKNQKPKGNIPESVADFEEAIEKGKLYRRSTSVQEYLGHRDYKPADCVEYLVPAWNRYAVSTNTRTSGTCAVLATGTTRILKNKGLYSGPLRSTTRQIIRDRPDSVKERTINALTGSLGAVIGTGAQNIENTLSLPSAQGHTISTPGAFNVPMQAGISGEAGGTTTSLPNVANLTAAGSALKNTSWMTGAASGMRSTLLGLSQNLSPSNFMQMKITNILSSAKAPENPFVAGGSKGNLLVALYNLLTLQISDGVETPRNKGINTAMNILADGLPPFFWDVKVADIPGRKVGEEHDIQIRDNDLQHYHERRYNLGPLVYMPLLLDIGNIDTAQQRGVNGKIISLPDYSNDRHAIKALGKARIYFRQPADHWLHRLKAVTIANLMQPYWQVRNENLSYVDKWSVLLLDGLTGALSKINNDSLDDTENNSPISDTSPIE